MVSEFLPQRADWAAVKRAPRRDVLAGITVAIVALPLALAFGATSGLGAQAGLVTAVIAGLVAAVFGGSNLQVSGPTGAMTVVLVPVIDRFGVEGVLLAGAMAGVVLIAMALARLGRFVRYLPLPVIEGFTAGIAVVIALQQVPAALGVADAEGEKVWQVALDAVGLFVSNPDIAPVLIAGAVAATMLIGARVRPRIPFSLLGIAGATVLVHIAPVDATLLGDIPSGIPAPSLGFVDLGALGALLPSALAIAALAALESLLSATVADGMSVDEHHDPDRELFGQGLANLAVPLFGGLPATAAIARTAVNVRAGASSKLAAVVHALVLAIIVFSAGSLVSQIPLAALAGVLLATTVRMVDPVVLRALARSTPADAAVLALTFVVTVAVDLVTAVAVGVGVAVVLALRAVAQTASVQQVPLAGHDHSAEERELLARHIVAYRPEGPLFFAAANRFLAELTDVAHVEVLILRMSRISTMDATGAHILGDAIAHLEHRGITVLMSGITEQHHELLTTLGVAEALRLKGRVFTDTPAAIECALRLVGSDPGEQTGSSPRSGPPLLRMAPAASAGTLSSTTTRRTTMTPVPDDHPAVPTSSPIEARDVVVVGGGIAGIEAIMALADLGDNRLRLRLVCDRPSFVLPRDALGVPWGSPLVHVDLETMCRAFGSRFALQTVTGIDAGAHALQTSDGSTLSYDRLLLAPGARRRFAYPDATTIGFGDLPGALAASGSVAIVVADAVTWTLPAYQLALMAAGGGRDVRVITAEHEVLAAFGAGARGAVAALLDRHGVVVETRGAPEAGASVAGLAETVVALPLLEGPGIAGLPHDEQGFLQVDTHGAVRGLQDVRAAGDATDHVIKQGGLAAQHADLAAVDIVRSCGGDHQRLPYQPVLRGKLVAADGEALFLCRALDGLDPGRASAEALWDPPSAICAQRLARWLEVHRHELEQGSPRAA